MSRIAKKPIALPKGIELRLEGGLLSVKGPKGELKKTIDSRIAIENAEDKIWIKPKDDIVLHDKDFSPVWGLSRALVANMIKGVGNGFERILIFQGVGFKAAVKGQDLELNLGFTNPVTINAPAGISFKVEKNKIIVSGSDKELVGQIAAKIRKQREPEPYQLSGIKYDDEVIIKKAGKKAVATAG